MKRNIFHILFAAWILLWAWFLVREIFVKGSIDTYKALLGRSLEEKRSFLTGDRLYQFLMHCRQEMPAGSRYRMTGLEDGSIEKRRAAYYLYPALEAAGPEYEIDARRYIIRKIGGS